MVYVPFEGYYESKGGRMQSPLIKLDKESGESAYYSLTFKAKTNEQCYWWVDFFDAGGKQIIGRVLQQYFLTANNVILN
jgi:hypothetical protein